MNVDNIAQCNVLTILPIQGSADIANREEPEDILADIKAYMFEAVYPHYA